MSHQPQRDESEAFKYGEVFNVSGELGQKPITPTDAATMQSVEGQILGETPKGGPAAVMESAAARNQKAGVVGCKDVTNIAQNEGVTISIDTNESGNHVITETLGGQVVGQYEKVDEAKRGMIEDEDIPGGDSCYSVQAPKVN
ncbi:hypothetical protein PIB30_031899 [Stylosanthes scabra]|uniref:SMP domain-containing protein n=1 Tax=Stylosanthes scabra TaxID=79078 RepID=A0ABU6XC78_9FABA|nr:hypothetical protein [Stylosanthes scabra]